MFCFVWENIGGRCRKLRKYEKSFLENSRFCCSWHDNCLYIRAKAKRADNDLLHDFIPKKYSKEERKHYYGTDDW